MNILSPSMLAADFTALGRELDDIKKGGAQYLHVDVMDGLLVPSISFGMPLLKAVRKHTDLVLDVHLMIENPDRSIQEFRKCGADIITVHAEAVTHLDRTLTAIRETGAKVGVALNPATPLNVLDYVLDKVDMVLLMTVNPGFSGQKFMPEMLDKIKTLASERERLGLDFYIEVDGGVGEANAALLCSAGVDVLVAGSGVFGKEDRKAAITALIEKGDNYNG